MHTELNLLRLLSDTYQASAALAHQRRAAELTFVSCCKAVTRHALAHDKGRLQKTLQSAHIHTQDARAGWCILKSLLERCPKGFPRLVKDTAGNLITSAAKAADSERWHESLEHISRDRSAEQGFNSQRLAHITKRDTALAQDPHLHQGSVWENTSPPTLKEISAALALATCNNGRAAGIDNIPFEAYKYGGEHMLTALTSLFTLVWTWECHPTHWDDAHIIPLFKGGPNLCNIDSYRAITLLS